jgi:tripartite-type tricarboxylate transporter receptor subunit TctC
VRSHIACALAALALVTGPVIAQQYPARPTRLVVPFAAGGPNDVVARLVGPKLTEAWGYPVVVDNRPGAGGNIGTELVAKAPPDGYTIALVGMHFVVNPSLYQSVGYDAIRDFTPVTNAAISPVIVVAHPSLPAKDTQQVAQLAKKTPLSYGSPGTGTAGHLAGALFDMVAGVTMRQIPYKGAAPAINDLLGGHIQLAFMAFPPALPHVQSGKLRAIAVTTLARSASLPAVPTVAESGYPGFSVDNMYAFVAPALTPSRVVEKLNRDLVRIVRSADVKERLTGQGFDTVGNSPSELAAYLRSEVDKWSKVIRQSGLRLE